MVEAGFEIPLPQQPTTVRPQDRSSTADVLGQAAEISRQLMQQQQQQRRARVKRKATEQGRQAVALNEDGELTVEDGLMRGDSVAARQYNAAAKAAARAEVEQDAKRTAAVLMEQNRGDPEAFQEAFAGYKEKVGANLSDGEVAQEAQQVLADIEAGAVTQLQQQAIRRDRENQRASLDAHREQKRADTLNLARSGALDTPEGQETLKAYRDTLDTLVGQGLMAEDEADLHARRLESQATAEAAIADLDQRVRQVGPDGARQELQQIARDPELDLREETRQSLLARGEDMIRRAESNLNAGRATLNQVQQRHLAAVQRDGEGDASDRQRILSELAGEQRDRFLALEESTKQLHEATRAFPAMSRAEMDRAIAAIRPDKGAPGFNRRQAMAESLRERRDQILQLRREDPAAAATKVERVQQEMARVQAGDGRMADVFAARAAVQRQEFGQDEIDLLAEDEAQDRIERFEQASAAERIAIVQGWRQQDGDWFGKTLRELQEEGLPGEAAVAADIAGDKGPRSKRGKIAASVLQGASLLDQDDFKFTGSVGGQANREINEALEGALLPSAPESSEEAGSVRAHVKTAIKARYADLTRQQGEVVKDSPIDADRLQRAIRDVTGGTVSINGRTALNPAREHDPNDAREAFQGLDEDTLRQYGNGRPVNDQGKPISAAQLRRQGKPVTLSDGRVALRLGADDGWVPTEDGQPFILDLGGMVRAGIGPQLPGRGVAAAGPPALDRLMGGGDGDGRTGSEVLTDVFEGMASQRGDDRPNRPGGR